MRSCLAGSPPYSRCSISTSITSKISRLTPSHCGFDKCSFMLGLWLNMSA
ncbi:Uncharacterised protein [Vibrio cholerae]|nr:Uncharacterised protein [Vibrio cholerae]CSI65166.1 Uncharacterised protein [Vibrio cholerae]